MKTIILLISSFYLFIMCFAGECPSRPLRVLHPKKCDTIYEFDDIQLGIVNRVRVRLNLPVVNNEQLDSLSQ